MVVRKLQDISIHAPRTGSDMSPSARGCQTNVFQSTLPARGATRRSTPTSSRWKRFQSTLPARGATMSRRQCRPLKVFQSTLPARGATAPAGCSGGSGWYFNPRSPHGERPTSSWAMAAHKRFQSTLPARGATGQAAAYFRDDRISIHAPRTGSDEKCLRTGTTTLLFQSTLPARGATTPKNILRRITPYFNPRSPHGERQHQKTF